MSHHDIVHFHYNITSDSKRRARAYQDKDCVGEFGGWIQWDLTASVFEYGRELLGENQDNVWEWESKGVEGQL